MACWRDRSSSFVSATAVNNPVKKARIAFEFGKPERGAQTPDHRIHKGGAYIVLRGFEIEAARRDKVVSRK